MHLILVLLGANLQITHFKVYSLIDIFLGHLVSSHSVTKQLHDARIASGDVHWGCCYVVPTERVYLDPLPLPVDPLRANRRAF